MKLLGREGEEMLRMGWLLLSASAFLLFSRVAAVEIDPKGYVIYCPCMGRFGNQLEHHLGAFEFAGHLGRTLVLPPVVSYERGTGNSKMIPFEDIFSLSTIRKAYKVITVNEFQRHVMPVVWPEDGRRVFCWSPRSSIFDKDAAPSCNAKEGNPFGPFWDYIGVTSFAEDIYFGPLTGGFETTQMSVRDAWKEQFPAVNYSVLAFAGAPASFPSHSGSWRNQANFRWNSRITARAKAFIEKNLQRPFVAIHLRNDIDWAKVCEHIDPLRNLFASEQCLGHSVGEIKMTKDICSPSKEVIYEQVIDEVGRNGAKSVFVSADRDHLIEEINSALTAYEVKAHRLEPDDPFVSLAILEMADHFIGNCVSTFSAAAHRAREYKWRRPRPTSFFGIPNKTSPASED